MPGCRGHAATHYWASVPIMSCQRTSAITGPRRVIVYVMTYGFAASVHCIAIRGFLKVVIEIELFDRSGSNAPGILSELG